MKLLIATCTICMICLCSCGDGAQTNASQEISQDAGFETISAAIKDSLLHFKDSGLTPFALSTATAAEPEVNPSLEWILQNGSTQDFEELLYNHADVGLKAIGVKGLIRGKDKALFKHLKFAIDQDVNVDYGMRCQKFGGYFLYQLNFSLSDSSSSYLSQDELEELHALIEFRKFGCT